MQKIFTSNYSMEKQTHNLYNWEIQIDFYQSNHWYKIGKEFIPSVSSIVWQYDKSKPLMIRAEKLSRDYLLKLKPEERTNEECIIATKQHQIAKDEAASAGSIVHDWCLNRSKWVKQDIPEDTKVANWVIWFLEFVNKHNVKILESETLVYSKQYNYVGTFDGVAMIDWKKYLIDYKTSKWFYPFEQWMQLVWYKTAREEERGERLDWMAIIHLDKELWEFSFYDLTEYAPNLFRCFSSFVEIRHVKKLLDPDFKKYEPNRKS